MVKQGVRGYVLADRVKQLQPAHEGIELPEAYQPLPDFKAVYSATADVNLSIRKEKDENAKLLGTVYENESVDVMDFDEKWAHVKKEDVYKRQRHGSAPRIPTAPAMWSAVRLMDRNWQRC